MLIHSSPSLLSSPPPCNLLNLSFFSLSSRDSWDRQVFLTYKGAGTTGFMADWNVLTKNFLISNYESSQAVDK